MSSTSRPSHTPPSATGHVQVLRIDDDQAVTLRFVGPYTGLLTHWAQGRSLPCPGESACSLATHRARTLWKGYAPVEWWGEGPRCWYSAVLEITESLEELLRGRDLRGEVWHLTRPKVRRASNKLLGVYCERHAADVLPATFAVEPVLLRFYHVQALHLGVANPMPSALRREPSQGPAPHLPVELLPEVAAEQTAADRKRVAEEIKKAGGMRAQYEREARQRAEGSANGNGQPKADRGQ